MILRLYSWYQAVGCPDVRLEGRIVRCAAHLVRVLNFPGGAQRGGEVPPERGAGPSWRRGSFRIGALLRLASRIEEEIERMRWATKWGAPIP